MDPSNPLQLQRRDALQHDGHHDGHDGSGSTTPPQEGSIQPTPLQESTQESSLDISHITEHSTPSSTDSLDSSIDSSFDSIDLSILFNCLNTTNVFDINWNKVQDFHVPIEKSVVNLSEYTLSSPMISMLSKGLSFCPMPGEPNLIDLKNDLFKFEHNLKWRLHFANQNTHSTLPSSINHNGASFITIPQSISPFESPKFKNKSERPGHAGPPNLETLFLKAHDELDKFTLRRTPFQNLSREENRAIYELKNNPEIVIKKADKGSAIVIMNTRDYVQQCLKILQKDEDYESLDHDPSDEFRQDIEVTLKRMLDNNEITLST